MPQQIINGVGKAGFRMNKPVVSSYDADALAYFNANTAITSTADKEAINTFFLGLKTDGVYTKIKAMYLPIWGTAATCKWNLVNPVDSNPAFRLTFHGTSWSFTNGGIQPTNAYANTYITPLTHISNTSAHVSFYNRTNTGTGAYDMGSYGAWPNQGQFYINFAGNYSYQLYLNNNSSNLANIGTGTPGSNAGFFIGTRNSTTLKLFRNGTVLTNPPYTAVNNSSSTSTNSDANYWLGACSYGTQVNGYGIRRFSFASIGDGLTDVQTANFNTRVQTLMTYFNINV